MDSIKILSVLGLFTFILHTPNISLCSLVRHLETLTWLSNSSTDPIRLFLHARSCNTDSGCGMTAQRSELPELRPLQ